MHPANPPGREPRSNQLLLLSLVLLATLSLPAAAQTVETHSLTNLNLAVPDGNASGLSIRTNFNSSVGAITALTVRLKVAGNFNGDLYAYLRHVGVQSTNFCVLLNRAGRAAASPDGYDDAGLNVTFDSGGASQDIHLYRQFTAPASGAPLTGIWQPDGRTADPFTVTDAAPRATALGDFNGIDASGEWTLFVADLESGGTNLLVNWELEITGRSKPVLAWAAPADLIYGTPLGASQLNANASVPGSFVYVPAAGAVLNAGSAQALSVTFTPADLTQYVAVTGQVSINVLQKDLTITANPAAKVYGAPLPPFSATFAGFVNNEGTNSLSTQPVLTTPATATSPAGSYDIIVSGATASNYAIAQVKGTLIIARSGTIASLASSSSPLAQLGQNLTFTFQANAIAPGAGTVAGTVQFKTNGAAAGAPVNLSGGAAVYATAALPGGTNLVAAEYAGDANFTGTTNILVQVINRPPLAGTNFLTRSLTNGAKVLITDLLANGSDPDGDPVAFVSASATSTNGGTVTTNGAWVYYHPATISSTNVDAFAYTIADGRGGQATGWVVVNPSTDAAPSPNLVISSLGNGAYVIQFDGVPGLTYRIQSTTNLTVPVWLLLGSATADPVGRFSFTNTPAAGETNRFYRSVFP